MLSINFLSYIIAKCDFKNQLSAKNFVHSNRKLLKFIKKLKSDSFYLKKVILWVTIFSNN